MFKSYEDAIHDIRVDLYLDGIKPRKESEGSSEDITLKNAGKNRRMTSNIMNQQSRVLTE